MENHHKIIENTEFLEFVSDIPLLNEFNAQLQQQKILFRKRRITKELQDAREAATLRRAEVAARLAAKQNVATAQQSALSTAASRLHEADENPIKDVKKDSRPEYDQEDHDRNRKREERREDKQANILSQVVIVKNNNNDKTMLIMASDFNSSKHTLILGETNKESKGPVTYDDIDNLTQDPSFMNTKTSTKLIGKIQEEQQNDPDAMAQQAQMQQAQMQQQAPQSPAAVIPQPKNGKEKVDATSSYPDWDHSEEDLLVMLPDVLNSTLGKPVMPMAMPPQSQTLQKAAMRIVSSITRQVPDLQQYMFVPGNQIPANTTNMWFNAGLPSDVSSGQIVGQSETGQVLPISVKVGPQTTLISNPVDAKLFVTMAFVQLDPVYYSDKFKQILDDVVQQYRNQKNIKEKQKTKVLMNPQFPSPNQIARKEVVTPDMELDQFERLKENVKKKIQNGFLELINESTSLKTNIIYQSLSGKSKFVDQTGVAKVLLSASLDGTNAKLIPLDMSYCRKVAKGRDTKINIVFADAPLADGSILDEIIDGVTDKAGTQITEEVKTGDLATKLEKLFKDIQQDPFLVLEAFELQMQNIVYVEPIYYSDYYTPVSNSYNSIIFNPGFSNEHEVTVSVEDESSHKYNDSIENESQLMENYLFMNDILVDKVNSKLMSVEQAKLVLDEEFNLLNERQRDYKKEYREYHGKPEQIKRRAGRVKARRKAMRQGRVRKGDGKDVHHKNGNPRDNSNGNTQVMSKHKNRSIKEEHGAGEEGTDELRQNFVKHTPFMVDPVKFKNRFKKK